MEIMFKDSENIKGKVYEVLTKEDQQLIFDMLKDPTRVIIKEELGNLGFEYRAPKELPYDMVKEGVTWEDIFRWLR